LKALMPRLHISVEVATHAQITDQLLSGACDIGVAAFVQSQHPAVTAQVIGTGAVVCAMAPTHPLAKRKRLTLADVRRHDVISFGAATAHGKVVSGLLGVGDQPVNPTVEVRYAYVACSIAASGWGLALVDDLTASRFVDSGALLRPLTPAVRYQACTMSSAERPLSTAGRELVRLLGEHWPGIRVSAAVR